MKLLWSLSRNRFVYLPWLELGTHMGLQTVGALLLRATPLVFQGQELSVSEDAALPPAPKKAAAPSNAGAGSSTAAAAAPFVPRGVMSRPRAGIGSKKRAGQTAVSAGAGIVSKASTDTPMDTSDATSAAVTAANGGKGQDDFRKMLGS